MAPRVVLLDAEKHQPQAEEEAMNKTLMYIQADMHRAINEGRKHVEVSVLDLKEMLSHVLKAEYQEVAAQAHIFGWINPEKLREIRENRRYYASVRRGKNADFSVPVFCLPTGKPVDAIAAMPNTTPLQSDE